MRVIYTPHRCIKISATTCGQKPTTGTHGRATGRMIELSYGIKIFACLYPIGQAFTHRW